MNKADLILKTAETAGVSKAMAEKILDSALTTIKTTVCDGQEVRLVGFGTFLASSRKARMGRNPQTGEPLQIPASKFPKFRPGAEFKETCK
jgi:DNA-binding protein HU-beta